MSLINKNSDFKGIITKIIIGLIIAIFVVSSIYAASPKDDVHQFLVDKYSNMKTLNVKFKLKDTEMKNAVLEGTVRAKKGNMYYFNIGNRILICNGKDMWNYSIKEKTVILSKFNKNSKDFSFEDIFFSLIKNSKPVNYSKITQSDGKIFNSLELEINQELKDKFKITELKLAVDDKKNIKAIEMINGKNIKTWEIIDFNINPDVSDTEFSFNPPKDVELIDLR